MTTINRGLDFPYHYSAKKMQDWYEAQAWCERTLGERWDAIDNRTGTWCCFWSGPDKPTHYDWYFLRERDAVEFALRWL